jgi:hypothetical protein
MILSFYDKTFKGLQNNASLVIDSNSYLLTKRGVDLDELKCVCEPFTQDIQPCFIVVKNDVGNYVYGCLAGIPELTAENKTTITGTDLKTMFKSEMLLDFNITATTIADVFNYVFDNWKSLVNQSSFNCELVYKEYTDGNAGAIVLEDLIPVKKMAVYDVWDIFSKYLKFYGLYMTSSLDLINKKVVFTVGKSLCKDKNIKLWEYGMHNYGKLIGVVNECRGYVYDTTAATYTAGFQWILTSQNAVTTNTANRDIYPIKRKVVLKETDDSTKVSELLAEANQEALELLCDSMFNENIELSGIDADFETKFNIYVKRGGGLYKSLPCGELVYDSSGLKKIQIGYRFTGIQFLL